MEELNVSRNQLQEPWGIKKQRDLKILDVSFNQLKDYSFVLKFRKLEYLNLSGNQLSRIYVLTSLQKLSVLDISHNQLDWLPDLTEFHNLDKINLTYNHLTQEKIMEQMPKKFTENQGWLNDQVKYQNINDTVEITEPQIIDHIKKTTAKIAGTVSVPGAAVQLTVYKDGVEDSAVSWYVNADADGKFSFDNLNLSQWKGNLYRVSIGIYYYSEEYQGYCSTSGFNVRLK